MYTPPYGRAVIKHPQVLMPHSLTSFSTALSLCRGISLLGFSFLCEKPASARAVDRALAGHSPIQILRLSKFSHGFPAGPPH